ncbi:MAG: GHKL domain-containing protein [Acetatifactor sp.]|nr:GHKL domain-containing protein [Acetatifactor sp.]
MAEYIDLFNVYIMGSIEILFQFCYFIKILKKKVSFLWYFLFTASAFALIYAIPLGTTIGFVMLVLLLTAGGILFCHADFWSSLLYAALVALIMQLCYGSVKSLLSILNLLMPAALHNTDGIVFMLVGEGVSLMLAGICYDMVYRYFSVDALYPRDVLYPLYTAAEMRYMFLVFIPILMIFLMGEYINTIVYGWEVIKSDGSTEYLVNHWQMFFIQILGMASLFCVLFAYKKLLQSFRLSTELSLLEQEEHSLNQYVEETKARYDRTKSFRHDIRNHIAVVKKLLQSGKLDEAVSYMEDMDDMAERMSFPCSTNNPVVDILVGNKLGIAKSMGIGVDCSLLLPYPCGLRDIDICIVLSNALDNAIHACKSLDAGTEKYIQVAGRIQGDFLMIETRNSFHGKGAFKKGTGLSNVKMVAEKYGGAMSIETKGDIFVLHVLLVIPQHPEDIPQQMD